MARRLLSTVLRSASSREKSSPSPPTSSLAKPNTPPSSSKRLNLSKRQNLSYRIVLQVHCYVLLKLWLVPVLCVQKSFVLIKENNEIIFKKVSYMYIFTSLRKRFVQHIQPTYSLITKIAVLRVVFICGLRCSCMPRRVIAAGTLRIKKINRGYLQLGFFKLQVTYFSTEFIKFILMNPETVWIWWNNLWIFRQAFKTWNEKFNRIGRRTWLGDGFCVLLQKTAYGNWKWWYCGGWKSFCVAHKASSEWRSSKNSANMYEASEIEEDIIGGSICITVS